MAYDKMVDSTQLDGAMTATANAIRARTGSGDTIAWDASTGFKNAIEHLDDWHKPAGWPDIEQLPLPSGDESCVYFLYDCETEIRYAYIRADTTTAELSIASYKNGTLGEFDSSMTTRSGNNYLIELPNDCKYAVLRLRNASMYVFEVSSQYDLYNAGNNFGSNQPCLWVYGKLYASTSADCYANQTAGISTMMLERFNIILKNVTLGYGFQSASSLKSFIINNGDLKGIEKVYTSTSFTVVCNTDVVLKNIYTTASRLPTFGAVRNSVNLDGFMRDTGSINCQQTAQNNRMLKSYSIRTNSLKITSLYYAFDGCSSLETVDMTGCDLSECTEYTNTFGSCRSLKNLTLGSGINKSLSLAVCHSLSHDSLVNGVIAKLATVETTQTLTLSSMAKARLTAEEIAVATAKGWTVA